MGKRRESEARRMAAAGYVVPAPLAQLLDADEAPEAYRATGRKHRHEWAASPSDATLDHCRWCGASQRVLTRQASLF